MAGLKLLNGLHIPDHTHTLLRTQLTNFMDILLTVNTSTKVHNTQALSSLSISPGVWDWLSLEQSKNTCLWREANNIQNLSSKFIINCSHSDSDLFQFSDSVLNLVSEPPSCPISHLPWIIKHIRSTLNSIFFFPELLKIISILCLPWDILSFADGLLLFIDVALLATWKWS